MSILDGLDTRRPTFNRYELQDKVYEFLSRERVLIALTVLPVTLLFAFVSVLPMIWGVLTSLHDVPLVASHPSQWEWVGLQNYEFILSQEMFTRSFWLAIVFAGGSVALQLTVGVALALLINKQLKFGSMIRAIVILPYLIPTAGLGFMALWMGNSSWGVINELLISIGLIDNGIAWYGEQNLAMISLILTNSWKFAIFVTLMTLARLQGIPDELYEAATMAGANSYQKFRDITLPNLKGIIFIVLLLRGIWMFNKFDIIWILTGGGPGRSTTTLPVYAYELAFSTANLSHATTVATIMFVLLLVVAALYFKFLNPAEEVRVE